MHALTLLAATLVLLLPGAAFAGICARQITVPDYPPIARAARESGDVRLTIQLGPHGEIDKIDVHKIDAHRIDPHRTDTSRPVLVLESFAKENIRQWQFCPAKDENRQIVLLYRYRLEGKPTYPAMPPAEVILNLSKGIVTITANPSSLEE